MTCFKAADETWAAWRARMRVHRDAQEQRIETLLHKAATAGELTARRLNRHAWRVGSVQDPARAVDFVPRTGAWYTPRREVHGRGWVPLVTFLTTGRTVEEG